MHLYQSFISLFLFFTFFSCKKDSTISEQFTLLEHGTTGLEFRNMLKETETFNIFKYQYFYNGGGVAIADFNNDGLQDICFTGNMVKNRLYLNKGKLSFEDITEKSGIAKAEGWCTGVNAVDINGDGWMDLYLCRAGYPFEHLRTNLLYINNRDLTFTEKAAEYGIDDAAYSTHSAFFDYDRDGDLDLFILNHSTPQYSKGNLEVFSLRQKTDPAFGNKLFMNDNGRYVNVTDSAGIKNNVLSFSLGLSVSDINQDGWQDIFIGNDFNESDYLFINNHDGTFKESAREYFDHTSMFSMGCDVADINNDQLMDLVSLDMLPESNYLQKLHSGADNYDKVKSMIDKGFQPQYMKNVLQINNGNQTFSEKAQMMGVSNTDWSWAPLFIDFNNDTYQDLFISNGYLRDHTDMDFLQFTMDLVVKIDRGEEEGNFEDYVKSMPPIIQPNYFFGNQEGKKFINQNKVWKLLEPSVSQGAAYGDLDNDGDLDIVVNNSNEHAWLYRNNEHDQKDNNFITFKLRGTEKNIDGLGSKVVVYAGDKSFTKELLTCRGFQSSVENKIFFGLGDIRTIDSIHILWPDGKEQIQRESQVNQVNQIAYSPNLVQAKQAVTKPYFVPTDVVAYERTASPFNDFKSQLLLPFFLTDQGPVAVTGDQNMDGREDLLIMGDTENATVLFTQSVNGTFSGADILPPGKEISDAILTDVDGDNDDDLVFTVGSYRYYANDSDKGIYFYSNDGKGKYSLSEFLPCPDANPSSIALISDPSSSEQKYIIGSVSYQGRFPNVSSLAVVIQNASGKHEIHETKVDAGCVNDMIIHDLDQNGSDEIIVAAEWKPLQVFSLNKDLSLKNVTSSFFQSSESGLWQSIYLGDSDDDGQKELYAGNLGTNNQLTASAEHPLRLYYDDYDRNGSPDPIIGYYHIDDTYPFAPREDMIRQVPMMNKRFGSFSLYAKANVQTLLGDKYDSTRVHEVQTLENSFFKWEDGKFKRYALPFDMQVAPVFAFLTADIDKDGTEEILTAGNMTKTKVKLGRLNGNHGIVLQKENNELLPVDCSLTGINVVGDVRQIVKIELPGGYIIGYLCHEGRSHFYKMFPLQGNDPQDRGARE